MICNCCGVDNAQWYEKYDELLCQECWEALERLKEFTKKMSDKAEAKYNQTLELTGKGSGASEKSE